jgi:hypothetical protein
MIELFVAVVLACTPNGCQFMTEEHPQLRSKQECTKIVQQMAGSIGDKATTLGTCVPVELTKV